MKYAVRVALCVLTIGCGPQSGSAASTGAADTSSSSSGTTDAPDASSTGELPEPTGTGATDACETGSGGPGEECTADAECSLEHHLCRLGTGAFEDCGVVESSDDVSKWQAARACAVAAAAAGRSFRAIAAVQGFDSFQNRAYLGSNTCPYEIRILHFDDDPCGGGDCGPVVSTWTCTDLIVDEGCTIEPTRICLDCVGQSETTKICEPG